MDRKIKFGFIALILMTMPLMVGCTPQTATEDAPSATPEGVSATQIIETYQAELTLTVQATPLPSDTPPLATTIAPTVGTPLPTLTLSLPEAPDKATYIYQEPIDGAQMGVNTKFDMVWTVENTGTTTWTRRYAIRYFSGWALGERTLYYLREDVAPGNQTNLVVDMVAPKDPGVYSSNWVLSNAEGVNFQLLTLTLQVVRGDTATPTGLPTPTFDPSNPPG
jgi:hypothetical protein